MRDCGTGIRVGSWYASAGRGNSWQDPRDTGRIHETGVDVQIRDAMRSVYARSPRSPPSRERLTRPFRLAASPATARLVNSHHRDFRNMTNGDKAKHRDLFLGVEMNLAWGWALVTLGSLGDCVTRPKIYRMGAPAKRLSQVIKSHYLLQTRTSPILM
ncbi:hypothetical protein BJX61DRAFT_502106 [Aspergillus egyptiacus]|nr:hypothetical protein BJX61DRAFT_502106 [Aspergillus egyptiacus]